MRRTTNALVLVLAMLLVLALPPGAAHAQKKTLVVALNQDPDILDPTLSRTYVGRIVYAQMCEKLYDIDEGLRIFAPLPAAPRARAAFPGRRKDGDDQAAPGCPVQRRHADGRRRSPVLARPAPDAEGLEPAERARVDNRRRGGRSAPR